MPEIEIKTTVDISLKDFSTPDLEDELADRGHAIDDDAVESADTSMLIKELQGRNNWEYGSVPIYNLIEALGYFGCPDELIKSLEEWAKTPIADEEKLKKWVAMGQD